MADPFGRAIRDHHLGEREHPLVDRDGDTTREHPIEQFYFSGVEDTNIAWLDEHLSGPLLELGAGAGRHALVLQERYETVATEVSEPLVRTMRERGVADARRADMFDLRAAFEADRFGSAFARGTQVGLAGSLDALTEFLQDLAAVTTPRATAVLDAIDPGHERAADLIGHRPDPTPGLAHRAYHERYRGEVGETLLFRLFSPERFRQATLDTPWHVHDVRRSAASSAHYQVALSKRPA